MKILLNYLIVFCFLFTNLSEISSQNQPPSSSAAERISSAKTKLADSEKSLFAGIKAENIGPTVQSGRVVDLEVNPVNPHEYFVAYASGGLWKTMNNGASFEPLFDQEMVMTIGDFDVNWETKEIWLGTGEVNSSRSSYAGVGIYYSPDEGKTWSHKGLDDSHHIGKVIIDPSDKNTVYVAALGHLYSSNEERGVFKSTDKGASWTKQLFVSENTGVVDMIMDPKDSKILYAAAWERTRRAWDFTESGAESGIYKSTDGGSNWNKVNEAKSGFPYNEGTGRIGLSMTYNGTSPILYALLDNYNRRPAEKKTSEKLGKDDFKTMLSADFQKMDDEKLESFLRDNGFPDKYSASEVKSRVKSGTAKVADIAYFLEDANRLLFDTPVNGAELYRSEDGGKTWKKTHTDYLDRVYNSYGYYFGLVRVAPSNPDIVYIAGVPILKSEDGGKTFANMNRENVHADHHALWINPENPNHIVNGNDGGINVSYDGGENYFKCNSPSVGQFYSIAVDNAKPYNVYGGLQDNGVWVGSHQYNQNVGWHQSGHYPYKSIMGGDGMQIAIDNRDNNTVYTGFQFGNYFRIDLTTEDRQYVTPKHELGDRPYRWNWQAPVLLSPHNQDIFYMGANKLLRSFNQGEDFTAISPDLTRGGRKGDVAYGTLTSFSESKFKFGMIYTGSDDGMVYRTDNGGADWIDLTAGLPGEFWVSRVEASSHDENTVYLTMNGYRWDDFAPYAYKSTNKGKTWTSISGTLPQEPINVIKEDPQHANILYVGTDHGTYISRDYGANFSLLSSEIPLTAVHDLKVQARENHLLIGTHGRSIYKIDLQPIYSVNEAGSSLVTRETIMRRASRSWGNKNWMRKFNEPEQSIFIFSENGGKATVNLMTMDDQLLKSVNVDLKKGYNYHIDDFSIDNKKEKVLRKFSGNSAKMEARENGKIYLGAGEYKYVIENNGASSTVKLTLK